MSGERSQGRGSLRRSHDRDCLPGRTLALPLCHALRGAYGTLVARCREGGNRRGTGNRDPAARHLNIGTDVGLPGDGRSVNLMLGKGRMANMGFEAERTRRVRLRPRLANKAPDAKLSAGPWAYFAPRLLDGLPRASDFRGWGDDRPWMQGTQLATSVLYEFTWLILHPQRTRHARLAARHRRLDAPDFDAGL